MGRTGNRGSPRRKLRGTRCTGGDTGGRWSDRLSAGDRDSTGSGGVGGSGRLFPRPSSARTGPSSNGVQRGINSPRTLVGCAVIGLVLGPPEALEVLAV